MKTLKLVILGLLFLSTLNLIAQTNSDEIHSIHAIGIIDNGVIKLRWDMSDHLAWEKANYCGYTITRTTIKQNGIDLSSYDQYLSVDTLETNLLPLGESGFTSHPSDKADVARELMFSDSLGNFTPPPIDSVTFKDAVRAKRIEENRYDFAQVIASQDFELAKSMALAYEDTTGVSGDTYLYTIEVNTDSLDIFIYPTAVEVDYNSVFQFPEPEIEAISMDSVIMLRWEATELSKYYTSYKIEKKLVNDPSFNHATSAPFVFSTQHPERNEYAYFMDSLVNNNDEYVYRIAGYTNFGSLGPYSDTVHITGTPGMLNISVLFNDLSEDQNGSIYLSWNDFNQEGVSAGKVSGYNIYKAKEINGKYDSVNIVQLLASDTSFVDQSPHASNYYTLECIDINGHRYLSYPHFIQLTDSIPPDSPIGLTGIIDIDGKVNLEWEANSEEDLKGYRVFISNNLSDTYVQQTSEAIRKTEYNFYVDPEFELDSLYVTMLAEDRNSNYSDFSDTISLERPDLVGPSNPVLLSVYPIVDGIEITWRLSETEDVIRHQLMRKPANAPGWVSVFEIDKTNADTIGNVFIDSTELDNRIYEYRLIAFDDAGNATPSQTIQVRPVVNNERGSISNFLGFFFCNTNYFEAASVDTMLIQLNNILTTYYQTGYLNYDIFATLYFYGYISAQQANLYQSMPSNQAAQAISDLVDDLTPISLQKDLCGAMIGWDYTFADSLSIDQIDFKVYRGVLHTTGAVGTSPSSPTLYKTISATDALLVYFQQQTNIDPVFANYSISSDPNDAHSEPITIPQFLFVDTETEKGYSYIYKVMADWKDGGYTKLTEPVILLIGSDQAISVDSINGGN